ncbi:hypothetical protein R5Q34_004569 [Salmonella enterica]|nr:hypothetical protein [Salmonella enterica]
MESTDKILDALGITEADIQTLDKTHLLILCRIFESVEQFGIFKDKNLSLEHASQKMQEKLRSRLKEMGPL